MMSTLETMLETFNNELEGIVAVYFEEKVIIEEPEISTIPKHVLSKVPPPKAEQREVLV
jgi:hypothetical protein